MKLTDSEWKIMNILWEESPRTMIQITNALKEETGWTKHTVMSFLKRLEEKKALHFEAGGKAKLYIPDISKEEASYQETESFLKKVFSGKWSLMLNTMIQQKALSEEEINKLYDILKQADTENKEG